MGAKRVFLIEDEECVRRVISRTLERAGFAVQSAENVEAALPAIEEGSFDAVVSDVVLPGMTGFQAIGAIRRFTDIPVILMSGAADDDMLKDALSLGAAALVPKGEGLGELTAALGRCAV